MSEIKESKIPISPALEFKNAKAVSSFDVVSRNINSKQILLEFHQRNVVPKIMYYYTIEYNYKH